MKKFFNHHCPVYFTVFMTAVLLAGGSCSTDPVKNNKAIIKGKYSGKVIPKPPSSFNDTLVIDTKSAVFYSPDSLQMEQIKLANEKNVFESITHDCFFQMKNAKLVLKKYWPQITIIETSSARFLLFVKKNTSRTIVDINSKNDVGGIFLFDMEKEPELIDMMNVNTALGFYFNK